MLSLAEEVCGVTCATRDAGAEIAVLKDPRNPNDGLAADGQVEVGVGIMKAGAPLYSLCTRPIDLWETSPRET